MDHSSAGPSAALTRSAAVAALVLWALGNVLAKAATLGGLQLAFWRLLAAIPLYLLFTRLSGGRVTRSALRSSLLGGVAFGLNIVLFYSALKATSVANAVIISAFQPVLVMAVSGRLFGEKVALRMLGLVAIALSGVVLVVFGGAGGGDPSLQGDLLAAAATFAWAAYFIGSKGARAHLDAVTYQTSLLIIAAITVTPIALVVGGGGIEAPRGDDLWWIVLMVLGPGSGHLLMNWVHGHLPLALTSTLTLALPGLSAIGAAIFLDEPVAALQALGMAVVVVALGAAIVADARITSARLARGLNRA